MLTVGTAGFSWQRLLPAHIRAPVVVSLHIAVPVIVSLSVTSPVAVLGCAVVATVPLASKTVLNEWLLNCGLAKPILTPGFFAVAIDRGGTVRGVAADSTVIAQVATVNALLPAFGLLATPQILSLGAIEAFGSSPVLVVSSIGAPIRSRQTDIFLCDEALGASEIDGTPPIAAGIDGQCSATGKYAETGKIGTGTCSQIDMRGGEARLFREAAHR
ncbi:MAG: hypothetical protein OXR62_05955 [Ahrensia sp.]|nr:hypothetical protein [Ahrensia sp.]